MKILKIDYMKDLFELYNVETGEMDSFHSFDFALKEEGIIYVKRLNLDFNFIKSELFKKGFTCDIFEPKKRNQIGKFYVLKNETTYFRVSFNNVDIRDFDSLIPNFESEDFYTMGEALKLSNKMGIKGLTIGSSAYNKYKSSFIGGKSCKSRFNDELLSEEDYYTALNSYKGSICILKEKCEIKEKTITLDINSMYPSLLKNELLPFGKPETFETIEDFNNQKRYRVALYNLYITKMVLKKDFIKVYGLKESDDTYSYEEETRPHSTCIWEFELEELKKYYDIEYLVKEVKGYRVRQGLFDDYINEYQNIKETTDNELEKQLAKSMLNSLYGKFASKRRMSSNLEIKNGEFKTFEYSSNQYYISLASFITAKGRTKLMNAIQLFSDDFVYSDTDSITFKGSKVPKWFSDEMHDKEFGKWKVESINSYFKGIKQKCYIKETEQGIKRVVAGVPKHSLDKWEDFIEGKEYEVEMWDVSGIIPKKVTKLYKL